MEGVKIKVMTTNAFVNMDTLERIVKRLTIAHQILASVEGVKIEEIATDAFVQLETLGIIVRGLVQPKRRSGTA